METSTFGTSTVGGGGQGHGAWTHIGHAEIGGVICHQQREAVSGRPSDLPGQHMIEPSPTFANNAAFTSEGADRFSEARFAISPPPEPRTKSTWSPALS